MWQSSYTTQTDVPAEQLYRAITNFNNWANWDEGLEYTQLTGQAVTGGHFVLKPKGGPLVKMTIEKMWPYEVVDVAHLPFAKMRTTHKYVTEGDKTLVHMEVQIWGLLGFLWRKIIGENQIKDAPAQTEAFIAYARQL